MNKLIAFDWDGTIADSSDVIADGIAYANEKMGLPPVTRDQAKFVIGLPLSEIARIFGNGLQPEQYDEYVDHYVSYYVSHEDEVKLFPGMLDLLQSLKDRGVKIAVATGKSRKGLKRIFKKFCLEEFFDSSVCMDESAPKPNPLMLQMLMDEFNLSPEDLLMVGDTVHDMGTAANAGVSGVAVSYGANKISDLQKSPHLAIVGSVAELRNFLENNVDS